MEGCLRRGHLFAHLSKGENNVTVWGRGAFRADGTARAKALERDHAWNIRAERGWNRVSKGQRRGRRGREGPDHLEIVLRELEMY